MIFRFADCELDTAHLTLRRSGQPVNVEPQVFDLLRLLAENPDRVVTRDEIVEAVWNGRIVSESAISARISAVRKAVGDDGKRQAVIRTVARRGLEMVAEVSQLDRGPKEPARIAPAAPQADTAQRIRYTLNAANQRIAYALTGDGPPLLRCSPLMCSDLEAEWRLPSERVFFDVISAHYRLLRFDMPGSGQSERDIESVNFDERAKDIRAVADAADFERFALLTQSGGVHAALRFAVHWPERVRKLVIVGGYVEGRARRGSDAPDPIRGLLEAGWETMDNAFARAFLLTYYPEGPVDSVHALVHMMQETCSKRNFLMARDAIKNVSNADLLAHVRCPTLIVHGRNDAVHPLEQAQKLAAGIPDAELVVLETANSLPLHGHPTWNTFQQAFFDFLAE